VDREDLFQRPVSRDDDLIRIVEAAASEQFDVPQQGPRRGYKWALRNVVADFLDEESDRRFINVTFSREIASHRGPIITSDGIIQGTSTLNPPAATLVRILIDLKRHIFAIEDVPSVIQAHTGWKAKLQSILATAAWHMGFSSLFRLDPVAPKDTVEMSLRSFEKLTRLRVTLSIPNPDLGPSFQRLYDEMKKGGVRELAQDMRNERGLNIGPDTLPRAAIDMGLTGYRKGKIRFYGLKENKKEEFVVADDVSRIQIEEVRGYINGYVAASPNAGVKQFGRNIVQQIDGCLGGQKGES
jgi:hypothetical protein